MTPDSSFTANPNGTEGFGIQTPHFQTKQNHKNHVQIAQDTSQLSSLDSTLVDTRYRIPSEQFDVLQEWEGLVSEIVEETFVARLTDITNRDSPEEEADFLIEELSRGDLKLLRPGAVFRWIIGYEMKQNGTKRRVSQIVFRRLPQWTEKEIAEADQEAEKLARSIQWA